jgi:hypothetical protein
VEHAAERKRCARRRRDRRERQAEPAGHPRHVVPGIVAAQRLLGERCHRRAPEHHAEQEGAPAQRAAAARRHRLHLAGGKPGIGRAEVEPELDRRGRRSAAHAGGGEPRHRTGRQGVCPRPREWWSRNAASRACASTNPAPDLIRAGRLPGRTGRGYAPVGIPRSCCCWCTGPRPCGDHALARLAGPAGPDARNAAHTG